MYVFEDWEVSYMALDHPSSTPDSVLAVVLGGGPGTNLFPLTKRRSEPAISFAGSYRLIDIPMVCCVGILEEHTPFVLCRHTYKHHLKHRAIA